MPRELTTWIRAHGGVAHTSVARMHGFSKHDAATAVARGEIQRVRRSWLVTPDCDGATLAAARIGGRATCVTAARQRGLWTPDHDGIHVAVPHGASRFDRTGVVLHWAAGPVAVPRTSPEEPLLNVLFHVARCLARPHALAVWESALRTRVVEVDVLARVSWHSSPAAEVASLARELSDSGVESHFLELMRGIGVAVRQQVVLDGHRVDGLIGDRLVVQLDGFAHHRAADRRRDLAADARLMLRGFHVVRFDYQQVLFDPTHVTSVVLTAMAQGLHRR